MDGTFTMPGFKRFRLPFDRGYAVTPRRGDEPQVALRRFDRFAGAPYVPVGDPLVDGVGPAAYAMRAPWPDLDMEGRLRIVPIGADDHFAIAARDQFLIGMPVTGADNRIAGTVTDVWIDRSDRLIRYLDVQLTSGGSCWRPCPSRRSSGATAGSTSTPSPPSNSPMCRSSAHRRDHPARGREDHGLLWRRLPLRSAGRTEP
jgi:photosynthetic reaction center subunit H